MTVQLVPDEIPYTYKIKMLMDQINEKLNNEMYVTFNEFYVLVKIEMIIEENITDSLKERIARL